MVYDAAHGNVVLFGGCVPNKPRDVTLINETWLWDGDNWTQANPADSPQARMDAAMAYNAAAQNVVLFGGASTSLPLNDTWTWDGANWTEQQVSASPGERSFAQMVHIDSNQPVVLLGGLNVTTPLSDMWLWNGSDWMQFLITSPATYYDGLAYDSARDALVLYATAGWPVRLSGGLSDSIPVSQTWTLSTS